MDLFLEARGHQWPHTRESMSHSRGTNITFLLFCFPIPNRGVCICQINHLPLLVASTLENLAEVKKTTTPVTGNFTQSLCIQLSRFATASLRTLSYQDQLIPIQKFLEDKSLKLVSAVAPQLCQSSSLDDNFYRKTIKPKPKHEWDTYGGFLRRRVIWPKFNWPKRT